MGNDRPSLETVIRRIAEKDLADNIDKGKEYTGFKKMYNNRFMIAKNKIAKCGTVYDIEDQNIEGHHLLTYLEGLKKEKPSVVIMTSGSFLEMNKPLQAAVVKLLKELSLLQPVKLYVCNNVAVNELFNDCKRITIKYFDRKKHPIPHFVKSEHSFNFVLPHTERKIIRVDLNSNKVGWLNRKFINTYFNKLIAELDLNNERAERR
jgi:hypothetical protein